MISSSLVENENVDTTTLSTMGKLRLLLYARARQASLRQRTLSGIQLSRKQALAFLKTEASREGVVKCKGTKSRPQTRTSAEHLVTKSVFDSRQCFRHCNTPAKHAKIIDDTTSNFDTLSEKSYTSVIRHYHLDGHVTQDVVENTTKTIEKYCNHESML